jgi:hypothetical protein
MSSPQLLCGVNTIVHAMRQPSDNRVIGSGHPGLTEAQARDIRVRALRFVLDCYERKKATRPGGPNNGTTVKEDSADASIPEQP